MSALLAYMEKNRLIVASDSCVAGSKDEFPKFQVLRTRKGPAFVGGVGWRSVLSRLLSPLQRACDEQGFTLANLHEFVPGAVDFLLNQRRPEDINPDRDIAAPPAQLLIGGFDDKAARMRMWLVIKNGVGTGMVHELAERDFVAIGFFKPKDTPDLQRFHSQIMSLGPSVSADVIAGMLRARIDEFASTYPDQIGRAAFFAAANERGSIDLTQPDFPTPWSLSERETVAR
jgi:hypothetical protein